MWDGRRWEEDGPGASDQKPFCTRLEIHSPGKGKGKVMGGGGVTMGVLLKKKSAVPLCVESCEMLFLLFVKCQRL